MSAPIASGAASATDVDRLIEAAHNLRAADREFEAAVAQPSRCATAEARIDQAQAAFDRAVADMIVAAVRFETPIAATAQAGRAAQ